MIHLLIVDDTKTVHTYLRSLLREQAEFKITSAFHGQEGLDLLTVNSCDVDLILLDWEMPVLNGPLMFEQMKKRGIQIPVILMTTKNTPAEIGAMLEAGVAEYLMKPFTLDILLEKIEFVRQQVTSSAGLQPSAAVAE